MASRVTKLVGIDLQAILDASPIGIGWSDTDGTVQYINNKFTELFGYTLADIPTVGDWYRLAYPDEAFRHAVVEPWGRAVNAARLAHTSPPALEAPIVCKDGSVRHVIITASWVGRHRLVNFSDITDRWAAEQELERQAHTDFLTELANRRYFLEVAEGELARTLRYGKQFSLLMLDIDHFKVVNDERGHKAGDLVLKKLARVMQESLREVDIVGRMGGEEFAAILPETGIDEAWEAAERLRLAVAAAEIAVDDGEPLCVTVSIGIATFTDKSTDIDMLLRKADEALYMAKHDGRNRVHISGPSRASKRRP
jgi:diguanylate cyclase (GGDEF)-like protein/PAS domain S-box-containing protein